MAQVIQPLELALLEVDLFQGSTTLFLQHAEALYGRMIPLQQKAHVCAVIVVISAALVVVNSPYLSWDFRDPEIAVVGTVFHAFEWLFVRLAPIVLLAALVGIFMTRKKV